MKNLTKKQSDKFINEFTKLLLGIGAKKIEGKLPEKFSTYNEFELDTKVGLLTISLEKVQTTCYTVFSRFANAKEAAIKFTSNPHSGKYNTYISNNVLPEKAAEIALVAFSMTLPE